MDEAIGIDVVANAMSILEEFGQTKGEDQKAWVIDQVTRALLGCTDGIETEEYLEFVEDFEDGSEGPDTYTWSEGIAP